MNSEHIVSSFDEELNNLENILAEMGGLAESQFSEALEALSARDTDRAHRVIEADKRIDDLERAVDAQTVKMLALRQPMADDLRVVISALRTSATIERLGDYAKNMAKRTLTLAETPPPMPASASVARMGRVVQEMLKNVLDAYLSRDVDKAQDVFRRDEDVDAMHTSMFREMLTYMMENPRNISSCTHLLFVAKNVERIGDLTTNIAEHVLFLVQGDIPDHDRPKGDTSSYTIVDTAGHAKTVDNSGESGS